MAEKISGSRLAAVGGAAWLLLAGCSMTGIERAEREIASIDRVYGSGAAARARAAATASALQEIFAPGKDDPRPAYAKFKGELVELEREAAVVRRHAEEMGERSRAFFANREAQLAAIRNPEIKARAEEVHADLRAQFAKIEEAAQEVEATFVPLSADLRDIERYLDLNLNSRGIASIKDLAEKAATEAARLDAAADKALQALEAARTALVPVGAPAEIVTPQAGEQT